MDVTLRSYVDGAELRFPVPPREKVSVAHAARRQTFSPLELGERATPRGTMPRETPLEGLFPGYATRLPSKDWRPPAEYVKLLSRWIGEQPGEQAHRLKLIVTDTAATVNYDVFVESFSETWGNAAGDVGYEITLVEWGSVVLLTDTEALAQSGGEDLEGLEPLGERLEADPAGSHVVQPGESLWIIARLHYGDGALWPTIYAANEDLIGSNPDLIQPYVELRIPPQ